MTDSLREARDLIKEQQGEIDRLHKAPKTTATVLFTAGNESYLLHEGTLVKQLNNPKVKTKMGDILLLAAETGAIMGHVDELPFPGALAFIDEVLDVNQVLISQGGGHRTVLVPEKLQGEDIKEGRRVILDSQGLFITAVLPQRESGVKVEIAKVSYEDIAGQEEAKEALRETVELPLKHKELFKSYNKAPVKGVMFYGPPGCGKTMLGKALATSLDGGFISVRGPELLNSYVGATEQAIRDLFLQAREYKEASGRAAVLFIDEADAILGVRGGRNSFMEKTVVPMFLTEMDGVQESSAIVILATNRPDQLDPAITREGRIDRKVHVARPDREAAKEILALYLSKTAIASGAMVPALASLAAELVYGEQPLTRAQVRGQSLTLHLRHVASGALLASIVERAASLAIKRDIAAGSGPSGVGPNDIREAVQQVYTQNKHVHHDEALVELADGHHSEKEHLHAEAT